MSSQVETSAAIQTENQDFNSGIQSSTQNVNVSSESTINSNSNSNSATATDSVPSVSISTQPNPQPQSRENKLPSSSLQDSIIIPIKTDPIPGCLHLSNLSKPSLDNLLLRYRSGLRWGEKTRIGQVVELGKENDAEGEGEKDGPPGKRRKLLPHPTCSTCSSVLSKPFLCLESAKTFCFSTNSDDHTNDSKCHLRSHLQSQLQHRDQENNSSTSTSDKESNGGVDLNTSKDPVLACEIHSGSLFCAECDDLVYDERFEEVLRQEKHSVKGNGTKKEEKEVNGNGVEKKEVTEGEDIVLLPAPCKVPRGLRNLGATCFMNVVLQSFFHNPLLRNFFLSDRHSVGLCAWKDNCLACELGVLFEEFYAPAPSAHSHAAPYGPTTFLFCIWLARESAELTSAGQHDAHELFISALNGVHAALIASRKRVSKTGSLPQWPHESPSSSTSTLTDQNQGPQPSPTFQNGRHHLNGISSSESQSCPCAVHRTFSGTIQSEVTCASCGLSSSTLDPVLDLSLDIRPPNWKNTNTSKVDPNNANGSTSSPVINSEKPVKKNKKKEKEEKEKREKKEREEADKKDEVEQDVEQCLRRYCAPERLSSSDYTCQHCGQLSRATKQLSLARLPPVLCIQLKRFEHNSSATKINTRVRFPQRLDVREFCTDAVRHANFRTKNGGGGEEALMEEKSAPGMSSDPDAYAYDLFTVIVHEGGMNTGHYRNFSKWKGEWYHFDDDKVTPCSISSVLDVRAYQLFYVRRNLQNVNSH